MLSTIRAMPGPVRLFLVYALAILGGIGLALPYVVDLAMVAPVSLPGIVVMVLLAYTIFTITLVLQRKEASRQLALGLSTLTVPAVALAIIAGQLILAVFLTALGLLLLVGLRRADVRGWLSEP